MIVNEYLGRLSEFLFEEYTLHLIKIIYILPFSLFDGYKECTRQAVLHKCSKEAADLGEQIVTKAGGPLVQTHCANFKHNSKDCQFPSFLSSKSSIVPPASYVFNSFMSLILSAASHFYISHR